MFHAEQAAEARESGAADEAAHEESESRREFEIALGLWREALEHDPRSRDLRIRIGTALTLLQRYREAEAVFRENLDAEPLHPMTLYHLAALYMHEDRFEEARRYLHLLVEHAPWYPDANYLLGYMLEKEGKYAEAAAKYVAERKVNPPSANAAYRLMKLQRDGKFGKNWDREVEWTLGKIVAAVLALGAGVAVFAYARSKQGGAPEGLFAEEDGGEGGAVRPLE